MSMNGMVPEVEVIRVDRANGSKVTPLRIEKSEKDV